MSWTMDNGETHVDFLLSFITGDSTKKEIQRILLLNRSYSAMIRPARLYLQKDEQKQDIFVDFHQPLHQHQIDGLRLLYKLYKKKKAGVILNDPSGYGKCIQTALFINAVRPLLNNRPVFILCSENDIENWKEHFSKWTDCSDDIAIESTNPFSKKLIYINTVKDAYTFCRRHFSILVIQDNSFTKDILRVDFKADFKIWLTSVDMKKNLKQLSLLYKWLYPNEKFTIEQFTAKNKQPKDVLYKSILLDGLLEDIAIRRDDFVTPYKQRENYQPTILERKRKSKDSDVPHENSITSDTSSVSDVTNDFSIASTSTEVKFKSRKRIIIHDDDDDNDYPVQNTITNNTSVSSRNRVKTKDFSMISTGTKIKSSRRLIIDHDPVENATTNDTSVVGNNGEVTSDFSTDTDNLFNFIQAVNEPKNDAMDVNDFIRDKNPVQRDRITDYTSDENTLEYKLEESSTSDDFRIAIDDLVENENKEQDNNHKNIESDVITPKEKKQECPNSFSICKEMKAVIKEDESATQENNNLDINNDNNPQNIESDVITPNEKPQVEIECPNSFSICKEMKAVIKEDESATHENNNLEINNDICNETTVKGENSGEGNNQNKDDILVQLAELEAEALKRYKGTFLDRLFS